ncbi:MAG: hypothetical protein ACKO5J_01945 [Rubrivivax sp.]
MSTLESPSASTFRPGVHPSATPTPSRRSLPRRLAMWIGLAGAAVALALLLTGLVFNLGWEDPVRIYVDGEQVFAGPHVESMSFGQLFALTLALAFAFLIMIVVVPVAVVVGLALAALAVVFALVVGLGLPVLILVGVGALLLSPLILLVWLLFKLLS